MSHLLLLCGLPAVATFAVADPRPPSHWEKAIAAFTEADSKEPPPQNAVLFIGSSSIRGWRTVQRDFPEYDVINRGFGGSTIADSIAYADKIVLPYKPSTIIFYAGENDLNAGLTPQQVAEDFREFVRIVHEELPETRIAFVSMKPSPRRAALIEKQRIGNELIREFASQTKNVDYIDVFHPMLNSEGAARQELFSSDNLHLNEEGYKLWKKIIGPYLKSVR